MSTVKACPNCDRTCYHRRVGNQGDPSYKKYRCSSCKEEFNKPKVREAKMDNPVSRHGLSRRLAKIGEENYPK